MFAPLASRQVAIIARSSNLRQFVGGFPVQAIFTPNQAMMFSTSAIRKDIDSAAKYRFELSYREYSLDCFYIKIIYTNENKGDSASYYIKHGS